MDIKDRFLKSIYTYFLYAEISRLIDFLFEFPQLSLVESKKIAEIKKYFEGQPEVTAVYLFGSQAKKKARAYSDFDLAVLYRSNDLPDFQKVLELKQKLSVILQGEIDIVVFNKANPILKHQVLQSGKLLFCRDHDVLNKCWVKSLMEYADLKKVRAPIEKSILKGRIYG